MIPLSVPNIGAKEKQMVQQALEAGWVSTAGPEVTAFEEALAKYCGVRFAIATNSGTAALHLALRLAGVGSGDLVIAPNLTFVASINPIYYLGAEAILCDVRPDTWQIDPDLVEAFLANETEVKAGERVHRDSGRRIGALMGVHVLGYPCDIEQLVSLGNRYGIPVVEDAAESMGSRLGDRQLGSFSGLSALSFNGNKIMTTGGGGAVLTNDPAVAEHARNLANQAKRHYQEYLHDEIGYNYKMTNLAAALGLGQLERLESFVQRKEEIWQFYRKAFADLEVGFVEYGKGVRPNHWLITLQTPEARMLEEVLTVNEIQSRKLWIPMDRLPPFIDCLYLQKEDISHQIYENSLSIPCSTGITEAELEKVVKVVRTFFGK